MLGAQRLVAARPGWADVTQPNVLMLSERKVGKLVAYCLAYELEDTLEAITDARRIDATDARALDFTRRAYRVARKITGSSATALRYTPQPRNKVLLGQDYDLFFPVFNHVFELHALLMLSNWRARCRKACCFITESWTEMLPQYLVELLSEFDHIFLGMRNAVDDVARLTGRPCSYLPLAVDVLSFAPVSVEQPRPISVCNIGRRSAVTHQALLADAEKSHAFYYYDTVAASGSDMKDRTFRVDNAREHRRMLANLLKRSNFFFANRSYVDRPEFTGDREEFSARFYEGAAAGVVMIGEAPRTDEFRRQFDWDDAVIHVPFDSPDIGSRLAELNADPDRLRRLRRTNVREAAKRHDWLHRLRVAFDVLDFEPTEAMRVREKRLNTLAAEA